MHITTPRLTLREFTPADAPAHHALESLPAVIRYQYYDAYTLVQSERYVQDLISKQTATPRTLVELAVVHEGRFVGRVGCSIGEGHVAVVWYSFMPEEQGKGFATEAVKALMGEVGEESRKADGSVERIEKWGIECDPRNERSVRMAERLGFVKGQLEKAVAFEKGEWVDSISYWKPFE